MHRLRRHIEAFAGPRWSRPLRLLIALGFAALGFVCYYFRLTSARGYMVIGVALAFILLLVRRALWKRSLFRYRAP